MASASVPTMRIGRQIWPCRRIRREDPARDGALDDDQQRDEHEDRQDPQSGQRLELEGERQADHDAHGSAARR